MSDRNHLDATTDIAAIKQVLPLNGLHVIDVGCGAGGLSRELATSGARVLGVDPDTVQMARNREAPPADGVTFELAPATELPVEDAGVDVVVMCRSLHHMAIEDMDPALREAARVLKPKAGVLCIIEPDYSGSSWELQKSFNNESPARLAAVAAMDGTASALFAEMTEYWFELPVVYPDFDAYLAKTLGTTYRKFERSQVDTPEVRKLFEAGRCDDGYRFEQPLRLRIYQDRRAAAGQPSSARI